MRLTQPFRAWQLAFTILMVFSASEARADEIDHTARSFALEPGDFPRSVVLVGELPDGLTESDWSTAVEQAIDAWNSVSCSFAELSYGGRVEAAADAGSATTVAFVDADDERCFVVPTNLGLTLLTPCDEWSRTAVLLRTNGISWTREPAPYQAAEDFVVDVRSVLTHELGHALGLGHDDVSDPLATMTPRYLRDGGLASLAADDKFALCGLYPLEADECERDASCPGGCVERDGVAVCEEVRVGAGSYCDLADLNCAGGASCLVTSAATFSGYCAPACDEDSECADGMACDEGLCQFVSTPLADGGCAVSRGRAVDPTLLGGIVGWVISRRRRRGAFRSPSGTRRGQPR